MQVTPFWFALGVLFKYRTMSNYRNPQFLGPRIGDKLIFSLIIMSVRPCPEQLSPQSQISVLHLQLRADLHTDHAAWSDDSTVF